MSSSEIRKRTLRLSVFDTDKKKSTRSLLGHALISLNDIDPSKVNEVVWRDLDDIAHVGLKLKLFTLMLASFVGVVIAIFFSIFVPGFVSLQMRLL